MGFLSKEQVNKGRQPEIDCLKAFCIFFMIYLHAFEELAENPSGIETCHRLCLLSKSNV